MKTYNMKYLFLAAALSMFTPSLEAQPPAAQQKQVKEKQERTDNDKKDKDKENKDRNNEAGQSKKDKHDRSVWDGTGGMPQPSKNQPAPVRKAFARDYPNATNVQWSKYRGDWTATFRNGPFTSTAVYHANGERRDTRTPIERREVPVRIDDIFKKQPRTQVEDVIKIERPRQLGDIFRVKTRTPDGQIRFLFFTADGKEVQYDY